MGKKKYRLKEEYGGQVTLTSVAFECTIKKGQELELTDEELIRMKEFVEPVPVVKKKKTNVRTTDIFVEEDK